MILGEVYPNIDVDDIEALDNIEAVYKRRRVTLYQVENLINDAPIVGTMYVFPSYITGFNSITFRYSDAYFTMPDRRMRYYEYTRDLNLRWLEGNLGIVVVAVYGGYSGLGGIPTQKQNDDPRTLEIGEELVLKCFEYSKGRYLPGAVFSRVHPSIVDLDFPHKPPGRHGALYDKFFSIMNETLGRMLRHLDNIVILDLRGIEDMNADVIVHTSSRKSLSTLLGFYRELLYRLGEKFNVEKREDSYASYIAIKYGGASRVGVIRIELSTSVRMDPKLRREFIRAVADAILVAADRTHG